MTAINHNLSARERRMLEAYRELRATGGAKRGWKTDLARRWGWTPSEAERTAAYLAAAGLIDVGKVHLDPGSDPEPEVIAMYEARYRRVFEAKRRKAALGVGLVGDGDWLHGTGSPILTPEELDEALGDREGGSPEDDGAARERRRRRGCERERRA